MNTTILAQLGLSQNEIKVYFALLELEQSTATPIVKKSGVSNSKVYAVLEKLLKKGLVSFVIKNNVKYFQASEPHQLIELISKKEDELKLQKSEIQDLIPKIEQKKKLSRYHQEASVYEGLKGVKTAFSNLLNALGKGDEYCVFTLGEELGQEELKHFFRDYHKKRVEAGIKVRLIAPLKIRKNFLKYHQYPMMRVKFSSEELPTGIFIFKDQVMTLVWGEVPTAFVIKSQINAEHYQEFFEDRWKKTI